MVDYVVKAIDDVVLDTAQDGGELAGADLMSPYVWTDETGLRILVRVLRTPLAPGAPTGTIWAGRGDAEGLRFAMRDHPAISPGPGADDAGGVEDPTVVTSVAAGSDLLVYYTGVDAARDQGCLMAARGPDMNDLVKERVLLRAPPGEGNIKEATVAQGADGRFRLFYEYAQENASRIGLATGPTADGPWEVADDPFTVRPDMWDTWHLSTGPIVSTPGSDPVMFYNGATADARWRIGWITFDANYTRITARCIEPLIVPPPPSERNGIDIAFAASSLSDGDQIRLYYSLADRMLRRASVRRYV